MCFLGILTRFLILIYGTLWPAFHTYRSLNKEGDEEFRSWSKYWIVYALLICLEHVADLIFSWMPLYNPSKILLVLWIVVAAPKASVWIYDAIVGPLLSKRQQQIDNFLFHGRERIFHNCLAIAGQMMASTREIMMPLISLLWSKAMASLPWNAQNEKVVVVAKQPEPEFGHAQGSSIYSSPSNSESSLSGSESPNEFNQEEVEINISIAKTQLQVPMLAQPMLESSKRSITELATKSRDMYAASRRSQRNHLRRARKSLIQAEAADLDVEEKFIPEDEVEHQLNDAVVEDSPTSNHDALRKRVVTKRRHINPGRSSVV